MQLAPNPSARRPLFCSAWHKAKKVGGSTYEPDEIHLLRVRRPSDQDTLHVCDASTQRTLCRAYVYRTLPYIRALGADAKVCQKCAKRAKLAQHRSLKTCTPTR